MIALRRWVLLILVLTLILHTWSSRATEPVTSASVLANLRAFYEKTAKDDGSFRPGIDPDYEGMSDSAASDLAPVTYAVLIHKTFGWPLPHEKTTIAFLLGRQQEDGAFVNVAGTNDPKSPSAR